MIVTRFAPSPTGYLHLGHAFAAMMAARAGGRVLLRVEDLDDGRCRPEFVSAIFEDLNWLGLRFEEPVLFQSMRHAAYEAAIDQLQMRDLLYPCFCTRKDIAQEIARAVEAPQGPDGALYPGTCRHVSDTERARKMIAGQPYALRLDVEKAARLTGPCSFREYGRAMDMQPTVFGDVVLARKDMPAAYHLAVVLDDAHQGVTLVTRGEDLQPACHIQRLLQALLDLPVPDYAHHPLILDAAGQKFSKRDQAITLRSLRAQGATPHDIWSRLGL